MSQNFSILENGQSYSLTTASQTFALPAEPARFSTDIMIYNPGPSAAFVRVGGAGVSVTDESMILMPGTKEVFGKGSATHLAAKVSAGAQNVLVYLGEGA